MEQIRIDLVPGGVTPNAHASQYDVGRGIRFLLYNGGNSYTLAGTETITVDVTKPDGTTDTVSVTNTSSNYVDFVTTDGLLNQAGLYPCEISIVDGGTEIGSQNFNLRAEADAYDGADIVTVTVGPADICTFTTTLAEPLQSVTVDIVATGGNGTPDNPNPINGYTEANITANGSTVTIAFGQTVYGGVLDVTRGKLHVEKAYKDLGTLNYTMYSVAQGNLFRSDEFDIKRVTSTTEVPDIISSAFVAVASANRTNYTISMTNNTARIDVIDDDYSDAVAFNSAMSGVQIVYPLETPFDIDLTPEVISAIVGTNNVFADCGETTVKYLKAGA